MRGRTAFVVAITGLATAWVSASCNEVTGLSGLDFGNGGSGGKVATASSTSSTHASSSTTTTGMAGASSSAGTGGASASTGGSSSSSSSTTAGGTGGASSGPPTAADLLALTTTCTVVSKANYKNDIDPMTADISVCGLEDAVFWTSGMSIDCDGASHTSTQCPSTSGSTAATDSTGKALSSVDLPFVVLPANSGCTPVPWDYFTAGLQYGSVVAVIYNGQVSYGVFGDTGGCDTIGSASYAMAQSLGIPPGPTNPGAENSVTYIAFTGAGAVASPIEDHATAVSLGQKLATMLVANN